DPQVIDSSLVGFAFFFAPDLERLRTPYRAIERIVDNLDFHGLTVAIQSEPRSFSGPFIGHRNLRPDIVIDSLLSSDLDQVIGPLVNNPDQNVRSPLEQTARNHG